MKQFEVPELKFGILGVKDILTASAHPTVSTAASESTAATEITEATEPTGSDIILPEDTF